MSAARAAPARLREAVIVAAMRTPTGKGKAGGALSGWHPVDLLAVTLRGVMERSAADPAILDDVLIGCVTQSGEQAFNVGRNAVLAAGFPETLPAATLDRQCGSSQQALHFAAQGIAAGAYDAVLAGGVELMSRVRMGSAAQGADPYGPQLGRRYPRGLVPQGISAELIAARWGLSRAELDRFAVESHRRVAAAAADGHLEDELLVVDADRGGGPSGERLARDEGVRPSSSLEALAELAPAFQSEAWAARFPELRWVIHAGNASQISDGAAAMLVMERERAEALGLAPRARVHATAVVGDDPILNLTGVVPATRRVLERAGLEVSDIDAFEVNEAFAPVVLAWLAEIGADPARVNVHGGAIANGHPLGASGAKLTASLLGVLDRVDGRFGLQVMCEGGGMANATVFERL